MSGIYVPDLGFGNGSQAMKHLERELHHGVEMRRNMYHLRQKKVQDAAKYYDWKDVGGKKGSPGFMRLVGISDEETWHQWRSFEPYFCADRKEMYEYLNDNPELKVEVNKPVMVSVG